MPKAIEVTQDHIDESTQRDSSHCMIAEAIKDTIPGVKRVSVDLATIRYTYKGKRYVHLTPRPGQVALLQFDNGEPLAPFKLKLGRPSQVTVSGRGKPRPSAGVDKQGTQRKGGTAPPKGPLAGGDMSGSRGDLRTGRIRRYGLKAIGGKQDRK